MRGLGGCGVTNGETFLRRPSCVLSDEQDEDDGVVHRDELVWAW